jgi:isoleucyl-tRNA synthetase
MAIEEVKGQYNPKAIEEKQRQFWEKNKIPHKLTQFNPKKKKFYFLDGPPYVNQLAHVGHVKTTTMKDIWSKFKLMQGFNSWFQAGFDCHGLPIENMVEKELGIVSKKQIEEMGVDKFIEACKKHAEGNEQKWLELYRLLGAWRGYNEPYLTYKNYYIQSGWWTVKKLFEKGMLVEGEKATFWCPHCSTALAGYEVTDSYADVKDPFIYVKFPVRGKENEYIVIATTTPWTLVSNVAITIHPNEYYVKAKVGKETLILSEKTVEKVLKELCKIEYQIQEKFLGKELEGIKYSPALDVPVQQKLKDKENALKIVLSIPVLKSKSYKHALELEKTKGLKGEAFDFVNAEEGSGCVHTAPGHGPEDNYIGEHYKLPAISPVDDEGKFTNDAGEFRGMFVKDADKEILERLEKRNLLLYSSWVTHAYPLCWRCKSSLIYRLSKQWFFTIDTIKEKMLKENEKVRWLPEFGRERFRKWLEEAVDWCISRQRYWGIPLPVWICRKCGKKEVIGSLEELREKSNKKLPKELDLHKHTIDKVELTCSNCNSLMRRVPDIMDVWFDSGISPWASLGYPFQNKDLFEKLWPCDAISESQDQIRGYFYSLMFCSVSAFNRSPYNSVGLMGWVLDEKGEKMSKSAGNVIWADEALEKLGADILRLYYCWEVAPWEVQNFSFKTAEEIRRAVNILWNSYSFFTTYCTEDFKPKIGKLKIEDKWILSRINTLVEEVTNHFENFEFHYAGRKLMDFIVNDLSRFYIKLIRDRVWVTEKGEDKLTALSTLHECLVTLSKLLAPITPFISEEIYHNLVYNLNKKSATVFESGWPKANKVSINRKLEEEVGISRKIIDACLSARQQSNLKLRWPISEVIVVSDDKKIISTVKDLKNILLSMCNSKGIKVVKEKPAGEFSEVEFDFGKILVHKKLDEKLMNEALVRELIREVQGMRKKNKFSVKESIILTLNSDEKTNEILKDHAKDLQKEVGAKKVIIGKLEGKFTSELKFEDKTIDISFEKI